MGTGLLVSDVHSSHVSCLHSNQDNKGSSLARSQPELWSHLRLCPMVLSILVEARTGPGSSRMNN